MYTEPCPANDAVIVRFLADTYPRSAERTDKFTDCIDVVEAVNALCLELDFLGYIRDDSDEDNPWVSAPWQNASSWATPTERLMPVLETVFPELPWRLNPYTHVPCTPPTDLMDKVRRHVFIKKLHALNDLLHL